MGEAPSLLIGGPAHTMPLHGKLGTVVIVCKGKPRNHGVEVDGVLFGVPCVNLRKIQE